MAKGLIPFDKRALNGASCLVGIDEAGRGCLAGPVVAAAVSCSRFFYLSGSCSAACRGVDDSKRLKPEQRAAIVRRFNEACHEKWIQIGIGSASVEEIEEHNILNATILAMHRAYAAIHGEAIEDPLFAQAGGREPPTILIDGRPLRRFPISHRGVVKGDQRSFAIALAGIHAKEWRDDRMRKLDAEVPGYGFASHKGYGTSRHIEALRELGPTVHHRKLFLRKYLAGGNRPESVRQDSLFQ